MLIGTLVPRFWWMIGTAALGGVGINVVVYLENHAWWRSMGFDPSAMFAKALLPRVVGALVFCSVVYGIARWIRKMRHR